MQNRPTPNRLADETSPYLLQHAWNPVDWYPWGPEALERARAEDKPILLSIGYAACHWCHVMAHESFEDAETAALMNEQFVCVKVDREERPDLDGIYMDAVQAMTGQGGWPMTVFLTPEGGPFYAGTYFPKLDRPGMPSFRKVLLAVADAWAGRREDARRQGAKLVELIVAQATLPGGGTDGDGQPDEAVLREAFEGLRRSFDATWGGFGPAPKFPQPMTLELLLRCQLRGFDGALDMAALTLDRLAARWLGATQRGNWEGTNVLWTPHPAAAVAGEAGLSVEDLEREVADASARLFQAREARVHPATDDKVLAAWNGLAISALAEAGRTFGERRYLDAALAAAEFVLGALRSPDGRLLRSWRDGRQGGPGYLDDHACMAEACLTLYETTFDLRWLREAKRLAAALLELFADPGGDGLYQTGADAEPLVVRPRELFDNAVPAGSSVAADVLQRLGRLTGEQAWEQAGLAALRPVLGVVARAPTGFGHALGAVDFALSRVREVAIVGRPGADDTGALLAEVWRTYQPNRVVAMAAPGDGAAVAEIPLLAERTALGGRATAYVCEHFVCKLPVTDPGALAAQLA